MSYARRRAPIRRYVCRTAVRRRTYTRRPFRVRIAVRTRRRRVRR